MRLVVKLGTNVLTDERGKLRTDKMENIARQICDLKKQHEIILVSSGAVAAGKEALEGSEPEPNKRVLAAVGQAIVIARYLEIFKKSGCPIGQVLMLRSSFADLERYTQIVRALESMLTAKIVPVINGNDTVALSDLTFGDNDVLAAMVAVAMGADKLVMLTNQTGLYNKNPDTKTDARLIPEVSDVDFELEKLCRNGMSASGRGGMLSKVRAAKHATHAGIETFIADGSKVDSLVQIAEGKNPGTRFLQKERVNISFQKRWLMASKGFGQIIVDDGAVVAIQNGKSLLTPGLLALRGNFNRGEIVEVMSKTGSAAAYGKVNYSSRALLEALVERRLNRKFRLEKEIIHQDHIIILVR